MTKKIVWGALFTMVAPIAIGCMGVEPDESTPVSEESAVDDVVADEDLGEAQQEVGQGCNIMVWPSTPCTTAGETCCGSTPLSPPGTCVNLQTDRDNCGSCGNECKVKWIHGVPVGGHCVLGKCM